MRPILVKIGPWEPWHLVIVFAVLLVVSLLWRRLEAKLDDTADAAARPISWPLTLLGCAIGSVLLYFLVNRFAPVEIKSYGVMLLVAFAAGLWWFGRHADEIDLKLPDIIDFGLTLLVSAVIGARLLFVLIEWSQYASHPGTVVNVWEGGLSFHGGVLGAVFGGLIYAHLKRKPFLVLADLCAAPLALGYSFARIGCFLNGCCHGAPTSLPWGVCFPANTAPGDTPVPVQPTQIYSALTSLVIFAILVRVRKSFPRPGYLMGTYLVVYSFTRFMLEYSRRGASAELATSATADAFHYALALTLLLLTAFCAAMILSIPHLATDAKTLPRGRWLAVWLSGVVVAALGIAIGAVAGAAPVISWLTPLTKGQVASFGIAAVVFCIVLASWPRAQAQTSS